jgi:hypothetical protein
MSICINNFGYYDVSQNLVVLTQEVCSALISSLKDEILKSEITECVSVIHVFEINKYVIDNNIVNLLRLININGLFSNISLDDLTITYDTDTIDDFRKQLQRTVTKSHYNGWHNRTMNGYHSFAISNIDIHGQRQPSHRLALMKKFVDFSNKSIIDFGCNTGGMIFHLPELKCAYGFDFNDECIQSCKYTSKMLKYTTKHQFIQQDLNHFELGEFMTKQEVGRVDFIFILSLGSWIKNWKELYKQCLLKSNALILETNNDTEGVPQIEFFRSMNCSITTISETSDDDRTGNTGRKTYLISQINALV